MITFADRTRDDEILKAIGLTDITLDDYLDQIQYAVNLCGIDHVAIGSDREHRTIPDTEEERQKRVKRHKHILHYLYMERDNAIEVLDVLNRVLGDHLTLEDAQTLAGEGATRIRIARVEANAARSALESSPAPALYASAAKAL